MDDREEHDDDVATKGPGRQGPGRDSGTEAAGEPLTEEGSKTGTSPGTPGETHEPRIGGPNEAPRREQPGL